MPILTLRFSAAESMVCTMAGVKIDGMIVTNGSAGVALYGPYVTLPAGKYRARILFAEHRPLFGPFYMDICSAYGLKTHVSKTIEQGHGHSLTAPDFVCDFTLAESEPDCELRLHCEQGSTATIAGVEFELSSSTAFNFEAEARRPDASHAEIIARLDRLERLSHGGKATYVGHNRVLSKINVGDNVFGFYVQADDKLLGAHMIIHGAHEYDLTDYILKVVRKTDHCLDIGANIGYYTCLMSRLACDGKTLGVEPDPDVYQILRDNLYVNCLEGVGAVLNAAVGEAAGMLTLHRRMTRSGNPSIIKPSEAYTDAVGEAPVQAFETDSVTVDDLLGRFGGRIDLIKIDVEGAEPLVFRGMGETLRVNPQVKIVFEWSPSQMTVAGFEPAVFLADLAGLGLQLAVLDGEGTRPITADALLKRPYLTAVLATQGG